MTDKPLKTRDELAIGVLNPRTGRRKGGYINMYRVMPNYRDKLVSGEMSEDELVEKAYQKADEVIAARENSGGDPGRLADDAADQEYRDAQEMRYREEYDWNSSNDEAQLQQLLDLEVQSRATNREFAKANLNVKDRTALLGELRNIAKDHAALQKALGIDRPARDNKRRSEDPMEALQRQIESGANRMRQLIEEGPEAWKTCNTEEELVALAKHHLGFPKVIINALLREYRRILTSTDSTGVS